MMAPAFTCSGALKGHREIARPARCVGHLGLRPDRDLRVLEAGGHTVGRLAATAKRVEAVEFGHGTAQFRVLLHEIHVISLGDQIESGIHASHTTPDDQDISSVVASRCIRHKIPRLSLTVKKSGLPP